MLCFRNLAALATMSSTGATAIDAGEVGSLVLPYQDGYCVIPSASTKNLRAVFADDQTVSVIALLGVTSGADISGYDVNFVSTSTLYNLQVTQDYRTNAHQTGNIAALFATAQTGDTFDVAMPATTNDVIAHQLWIGDGVRVKGHISTPRSVLGGAEIVQPPSGAIFASQRPSWRKYSVSLPAVTDAQWSDPGGLIELESLGNGAEALFLPAGVSTDGARVGALAIHGAVTGFNSQQIRRGLRAVTFDITECR